MAENDIPDDHASYTITRRTHIVERLMQMARLAVLINVKPTRSATSGFMTTITKVLPDKNVFAIEVSANEDLNKSLKNAGELLFTATVEGVPARFKAPGLTPASLGGNLVFAVPIPKSLYWRQRRRSYRLAIPLATPITCTVPLTDTKSHKLPVLDISQTGFSVLNENQRAASSLLDIGQVLQGCQFSWPAALKDPFTAELCRSEVVGSNGIFRSFKLGFRFTKMTPAFEKGIQNLLHELAQIKKRQNLMAREMGLTGRALRK
jgi:c-di-GMP-binding flagellar brake protein YcgR